MSRIITLFAVNFFLVLVYAQDGTLDLSFSSTGKVVSSRDDTYGNFIHQQTDGKIIVVGNGMYATSGSTNIFVQRFNADGSEDASFGTNGSFQYDFGGRQLFVDHSNLQSDNKILIFGRVRDSDNDFPLFIIRLNTDGTFDNTFASGGILETKFSGLIQPIPLLYATRINASVILPDGKIVIGGYGQPLPQSGKYLFTCRINSDGTIDSSFNTTGVFMITFFSSSTAYLTIQKMERLNDGSFFLYANENNFGASAYIFRMNPNGGLDNSFGDAGGKEIELSSSGDLELLNAKVNPDGKFSLVVFEVTNSIKYTFIRCNSNGTLDTSFGTNGLSSLETGFTSSLGDGNARAIFQGDSKVLIISMQTGYNIKRFNPDGSLDTDFGTSGEVSPVFIPGNSEQALGLAIQADNKILVTGYTFNISNNFGNLVLARYNSSCATPSPPIYNVSPAIACSNTPNTITVGQGTGAEINNYTWSLPNGWSGASTSNSIDIIPNNVAGTVSVTANNACGSSSPTNITFSLVNGLPLAPTGINGDGIVCANSSNTYSISPVASASNYVWSLPNGWTGTSNSTSITLTAGNSSGSISVKAQNVCGFSPQSTLSVSVLTSVPSAPAAIIGNNIVCTNSTANFSVVPVTTASSYTWTKPSGWTGTSSTESISFTTNNQGGLITVKANNACGSSAVVSLNVSAVDPMPAPSDISGNDLVCNGTSNTYVAASVNGAATYTWTLPGGWTGSSSSATINLIAGANDGIISVAANNECGPGNVRTLTVSSIDIPATPSGISGDLSICRDSSMIYSINPVADATSYIWTLPTGWTGSSTSNSITAIAGNSGVISVEANNMCGSSPSSTVDINVVDNPANPTITRSENLLFCDVVASSYQWYKGLVPIDGATSQTCQINGDGNYMVKVFNQLGCFKRSDYGFLVGLNDLDQLTGITVYPNPNTGYFVVDFGRKLSNVTVRLFDSSGKELSYFSNTSADQMSLNEQLSQGLYYVDLLSNEGKFVQKIIVN